MEECQEPGCRENAVKSWKGRKVCSDHYDHYYEMEEELRRQQAE